HQTGLSRTQHSDTVDSEALECEPERESGLRISISPSWLADSITSTARANPGPRLYRPAETIRRSSFLAGPAEFQGRIRQQRKYHHPSTDRLQSGWPRQFQLHQSLRKYESDAHELASI